MTDPAPPSVSDATTAPPPRRRRRWRRRLAWTGGGVLALLVVVYLLRGWLLAGPLAALVESQLEGALGGDFEVVAVTGSYFGGLAIEGVSTVESPPEGPVRELAAERISVSYSLWGLLTGDGIAAIGRIGGDGIVLDLDLGRLPPAEEPSAETSWPPDWLRELGPDDLPELAVEAAVALRVPLADQRPLRLEARGVELSGDAGSWRLDGAWSADGVDQGPLAVSLTGSGNGAGSATRWQATASAAGIELEELVLTVGDEHWAVAGSGRIWDGSLTGHWDGEGWTAELEGLAVSALPEPVREVLAARWQIPGAGRLMARAAGQGLEFDGEVALDGLRHPQVDLERVAAAVAHRDERWILSDGELAVAGARARLERAVYDPTTTPAVPTISGLVVEVADLSQVVTGFGLDGGAWPELSGTAIFDLADAGTGGELRWQLTVDGEDLAVSGSGTLGAGWSGADWAAAALGGEINLRIPEDSLLVVEDAGGGRMTVTVGGRLGRVWADGHAELADLRLGPYLIDEVTADLATRDGVVELDAVRLDAAGALVTGSGSLDLDSGAIALDLGLVIADLAAARALFEPSGEVGGRIEAEVEARGVLGTGGRTFVELAGRVAATGSDLRWGRYRAQAIAAEADFAPGTVRLDRLLIDHDPTVSLRLAEPAIASVEDDAWHVSRLVLRGGQGSRFAGHARGVGSDLHELSLDVERLPVGLLLVLDEEMPEIAGTWSGRVRLEAVAQELPRLGIDLRSHDLMIDSQRLEVAVRGWQDAQNTRIDRCTISSESGLDLSLRARFPFAVTLSRVVERVGRVVDLHAEATVPLDDPLLRRLVGADRLAGMAGSIGGVLDISPQQAAPVATLVLHSDELSIDGDAVAVSGSLHQDARGVRADDLRITGAHDLEFVLDGGWPLVRDRTAWRAATEAGAEGIGLRGHLPFAHAALRRLLAAAGRPPVAGAIDVEGRVEPSESGPRGTVVLTGHGLRVADLPVTLDLELAQGAGGIDIRQLRIGDRLDDPDAPTRLEVAADLTLPWRVDAAGLVRTEGPIGGSWRAVADLGHPLVGAVMGPDWSFAGAIESTGEVTSDAGADRFEARVELGGFSLRHPAWGVLREVPALDAEVTASADDAGWRVAAAASGPAQVAFEVGGDPALDLERSQAFLDRVLAEAMAGSGQLVLDDPTWLAYALPQVVHLVGRLEGRVEIGGTPMHPEASGSVSGSQIAVTTRTGLPPITELDFQIDLDRDSIRVTTAEGLLGYAPFAVVGSVPWDPLAGEWGLQVTGDNVLLVQNPHFRLRSDLDLTLAGPGDQLTVSGDIGITDLFYTQPIDLMGGGGPSTGDPGLELFSITAEPWAAMRFDLDVRDGPLDREWAGATDRVRFANNLVRGTAGVDLHVGGTGAAPVLDGRITTKDTKVRLPFTVFRVRQGEIVFEPEDTRDPIINAEAVSRIQGYEVTVLVTGHLSDLRIDVSTVPHLERHDAILLATTGLTSGDVERSGGSAAAGIAATYLGRTLLENVFSSKDPDAEPGWWSEVTLEIESGSEQGLSSVRGEVPLDHPFFLWMEFLNYSQYSAYNGGIGLRWRPGVDEEAGDAGPTTHRDPRRDHSEHPQWIIEGLDSSLQSNVRRAMRRSRRDYEQHGYPVAAVADAAYVAEQTLRADGYALAEVDFRVEPSPERPQRVIIEVDRGHRYVFGRIVVSGGDDELKAYVDSIVSSASINEGVALTPTAERGIQDHAWIYNDGNVDGLVGAIESWYEARGFRSVEVAEPRVTFVVGEGSGPFEVDVRLPVEPGQRLVIGRVRIDLDGPLEAAVEAEIRERSDNIEGKAYVPHLVRSMANVVAGELRQAGHLAADVEDELTIDQGTGRVDVTYHVRPGPIYHLRGIKAHHRNTPEEHRRTGSSYIKYKFTVERGAVLHQDQIDGGVRRLLSSGFLPRVETELRNVEPEPAPAGGGADDDGDDDDDDEGADGEDGADESDGQEAQGQRAAPEHVYADLFVFVEEVPARTVDIQLGYGSYDLLIGRLRYTDRNLFGSGRTMEITPEASFRGYMLSTRFIDRDLLARHLGPDHRIELSGLYQFREEPTFDRKKYETSLSLHKDLGQHYGASVGYTLRVEEAEEIRGVIPEVERGGFVRSGTLSLDFTADYRDRPLLPSRGWAANVGMSWSGTALGSEVDYLEYRGGASAYWDITGEGDLILALGARGITRDPIDDVVSLPVQFRLFNGGGTSVRSFEQNELGPVDADGDPVGGLTRGTATAELRWSLGDTAWHIAGFYDIGVVSADPFTLTEQSPGHALGVGLRYELPVGPLRLDGAYGFGERYAADDEFEIHGAVGFTF